MRRGRDGSLGLALVCFGGRGWHGDSELLQREVRAYQWSFAILVIHISSCQERYSFSAAAVVALSVRVVMSAAATAAVTGGDGFSCGADDRMVPQAAEACDTTTL